MQEGRYNLTNDEFHLKISKSFKTIYKDKKYTDVTLATSDEKQMKAHKVILSSFSPFFEKILERNPHEHPLIFLKGIRYRDLESLMMFAYLGECEVGEDDLQDFLEAGKDLQIHGLAEVSMNQENYADNQTPKREPPKKKKKLIEKKIEEEKENHEETAEQNIKVENDDQLVEKAHGMVEQSMEDADMSLETTISENLSSEPKSEVSCDRCDFHTTNKHSLQRHIRTIHEGEVFDCEVEDCDFTTKRKDHLKNHRDSKHEGIKHPCGDCGSEFYSRHSLNKHKKKIHSNSQ